MPILSILVQYFADVPVAVFNKDLFPKERFEKALIVYSLYIFFFKIGFLLSFKKNISCLSKQIVVNSKSILILFIIIFVILLSYQKPQATILTGHVYGTTDYKPASTLNILPVSFFILLIIYFISLIKTNKLNRIGVVWLIVFYCIGVIYLHFLKGERCEALGLTLAIVSIAETLINPKKIKKLYFILFLIFVFAWIVGFIRATGGITYDYIKAITSLSFLLSFSTFDAISDTFLICIDMIDTEIIKLKWFDVLYENIFLSTLPTAWYLQFFGTERPVPPAAFIMLDYHYNSYGGIHWFGSIYLSFGLLGIFYLLIAGIFFGTLENYSRKLGTIGNYLYLMTIMLSLRWLYYGGLSLYKAIIIIFLFLLLFKIIDNIFINTPRNNLTLPDLDHPNKKRQSLVKDIAC